MDTRLIITGVLFLCTLLTGLWLFKLGRPLNILVNTFHKLVALGTVILTGSIIYGQVKIVRISPFSALIVIVSGFLFILLFATGALLSTNKPASQGVKLIHKVFPGLAVASSVICLHLLFGGEL